MVQEVADDKMFGEKDTTKEKKDKTNKGKSAKDWKEDEVSMLNELLEKRPSLWDVLTKIIQNGMLKIQHIKKWLTFMDIILLQSRAKSMD